MRLVLHLPKALQGFFNRLTQRNLVKAVQWGRVKPGHKYLRRYWDSRTQRWRYVYYEAQHANDHHRADAIVVRLGDGLVGVAIEYDPRLKDILKSLGGKWDPEHKAWAFPVDRYLEKVRPVLKHVIYSPHAQGEILKRISLREVEPGVHEEGEGPPPSFEVPTLPPGTLAQLHPEQVEDAQALVNAWVKAKTKPGAPKGVLLASGTGTGKTYVYGAFVAAMASQGKKALVLVPNKALAEQTEEVLSRFAVLQGGKEVPLERGKHYEIATHATLRKPEGVRQLADWLGRDGVVVLDEGHRFKNLYKSDRSQQAEGALGLLKATGAFAVYSTATPFDRPWEAKYMAFVGIHKAGEHPAENFDAWVQRYGVRIRENPWGGKEYVFRGTVGDLVRLNEDLSRAGFLVKRFLRPEAPVVYEAPSVDLDSESAQLLAEVRNRFADSGGLVKALGIGLQRAILERAKAKALLPLIRQELEKGRSVAVFFQFLREKDLDPETLLDELLEEEGESAGKVLRKEFLQRLKGLRLHLESPVRMVQEAFKDVPTALYTGEQTEAQLRRAKEAWDAGKAKLFLLTGAKGGTGLSLHDTRGDRPTTQIVVTMPWTAIELDQILGRVVRRGLKSDVRILLPTTSAPVERGLALVIGQRLRTLGYAVRGGEIALPEEILQGFEHGLAKLDPGRLERRLEEIGRELGTEAPPPKAPRGAPEPIPLLALPPTLKHDPLQPSLFPEEAPVSPPTKPKRSAGGKPMREGKGKPAQPLLFPPDMPLFELAKALGVGPGVRLYIKAEERTIPVSRLKWVDRPRERSELPASHFLLPGKRKFPYRNKDGSVNCALLKAAISRAAQHGYPEVERRARKLYRKHCKGGE